LYASEEILLLSNTPTAVPTGIAMEIPEGYVGFINPRSSMAMKGITVMNAPGTIDSGYRGEVKVILINTNKDHYHIKSGDKIAQMVFLKYDEISFKQVEKLSEFCAWHRWIWINRRIKWKYQ
jgi:dUTP pyrophosphatase